MQYIGVSGSTSQCVKAVESVIFFGDKIESASILSWGQKHALLLETEFNDFIAIKSGFTSGYLGAGPRGLSKVVRLLLRYAQEINEYDVSLSTIEKLDNCFLKQKDLDNIFAQQPIRPNRWQDYIFDTHDNIESVICSAPFLMPYDILDTRLISIALEFENNPDNALMSAYRKLESCVSEKSGIQNENGSKLFSKAFLGSESPLYWGEIDSGEEKGRANIFSAAYMAYRNRRAHNNLIDDFSGEIRELLLINQLFVLESEAKLRECKIQAEPRL